MTEKSELSTAPSYDSYPPASAKTEEEKLGEKLLLIKNADSLYEAVNLTKPLFVNSAENGAAVLVTLYANKNMIWKELNGFEKTQRAKVLKNPEAEQGKLLCISGSIIEIQIDNSLSPPVFVGGLWTNSGDVVRFIAVGDTGELVADSVARICGIVTGTQQYDNVSGGKTVAVYIVGMFDLPSNKKLEKGR